MAGGNKHFLLRQDFRIQEGIMGAVGTVETTGCSEPDLASSPGSVTFYYCNPSKSLPLSWQQFYHLQSGRQ